MDRDDAPRILLPRATAERLAANMSRRRFLAAGGASAMALWLAACGSDSDNSSSGGSSGGTAAGGTAAGGTAATTGGTETQGTGGGGNVDRKINMFTWAEYDDPDLMKSWGNLNITIYNSNEEAIQKLSS